MKLSQEQINQIIEGLENPNTRLECSISPEYFDDPRNINKLGISNVIIKRGDKYFDKYWRKFNYGITTGNIAKIYFIQTLKTNEVCDFELVNKNKDKSETRTKI